MHIRTNVELLRGTANKKLLQRSLCLQLVSSVSLIQSVWQLPVQIRFATKVPFVHNTP